MPASRARCRIADRSSAPCWGPSEATTSSKASIHSATSLERSTFAGRSVVVFITFVFMRDNSFSSARLKSQHLSNRLLLDLSFPFRARLLFDLVRRCWVLALSRSQVQGCSRRTYRAILTRWATLQSRRYSDIAETLIKLSSLLGTEAIEHPYLTLCSLARCCLGAVRRFIRTTHSLFPSISIFCLSAKWSIAQPIS